MPDSPRFFTVNDTEGVAEIVLGTADFVGRPIIVLAKEEIIEYVDQHKPPRLVINFKNVHHISSEFLSALMQIQDHVRGNDGDLKLTHMHETVYGAFKLTHLADRVFTIYETTPEAIDAF